MTEISFTLSEDRQTVSMTFKTEPPISVSWSVDAVVDLLHALGEIRANMIPTVAEDFAQGQTVQAIQNPRWVTEPDALMGNSLLHLRDPKFGWLHYVIPRHEAHRLSEFLQKQADSPDPGSGSGKTH